MELITEEQYNKLEKIIGNAPKYIWYEVFHMIYQAGFDEVYNYLTAVPKDNWDDIIILQPLLRKYREEILTKYGRMREEVNVTSGITCPRCKSTKTIAAERQTRSADEPMTTYARCLECGRTWIVD